MQAGENNNLSRYLTQIVFVNISWHLLNQSGVPDGWVLSHQVAVKVIRLVTKKDVAQWVRSQIIFFDLNFYFVVCLFNFRYTPSNSTKKTSPRLLYLTVFTLVLGTNAVITI